MKSKKSRIYFYANLGDLSKPGYGGGEEGNRRTLKILQESEFEVIVIPKYSKTFYKFPIRQMLIIGKMIGNLSRFINKLFWGRRKNSLVHLVGFYGSMVYWEFILSLFALLLGYKLVYEMRGGGADYFYRKGNRIYKYCFDFIIRHSLSVFSQGEENGILLNNIAPAIDIFYYPNYVNRGFAPKSLPRKVKDKINLIFFGRLSETKHIDLIIKSLVIIKKRLNIPVGLTLIGKFTNNNYKDKIDTLIERLCLRGDVRMEDSCTQNLLAGYLADKHFYLFPTSEQREGHSNALTEAMSYGIIPIASSQGFNKSVISNDRLIVNELTAEAFADRVVEIIRTNSMEILSKEMYNRVNELYNFDKASEKLLEKYKKLFNINND